MPSEDKTYARFTEELNKMFQKYEINTCLRKIHFLAQSYHESDRFKTTEEYDNRYTKRYDPFRGRGILQITWSGEQTRTMGYKQYFQYLKRADFSTNYQLLNTSLYHALDVSGYFWSRGKLLSKGSTS